MGFQDVAFQSYQTSFYTTFLINCGGGCGLETTTCLKTVVGGKQGHIPCKTFLSLANPFFVSIEFFTIIILSHPSGEYAPLSSFGDIARFKAVVSVCLYLF